MKKCPCCGYEFGRKYNPSMEIISLLSKRKPLTKKIINTAFNNIQKEIPSDKGIMKRFQFLKGIANVDDDTVNTVIIKFKQSKLHKRGFGYSYLRSMILREHSDAPKKKLNELKRYGKPPSKRKKEKENATK